MQNSVDPAKLFPAFQKLNILIVGDVMIDRYINGQVKRISPEAPVPVVEHQATENRLGGAANVALNIHAMGANPILCSMIGSDEDSQIFLDLLPRYHLSSKSILQSTERRTTVKSRVLAQNQQLLRIDAEDTHDLTDSEQARLLSHVRQVLDNKEIHAILFQDYNKGILSPGVIRAIILEAIKRDIPTAVDPKYKNFWAYKHVTLFKPNLKEIRSQLNEPVLLDSESLRDTAKKIHQKLGNAITLITLSEKGLFIDDNQKYHLLDTFPRQIADVCGAGDTVISVATLAMALGADLFTIAQLANLAGGQVCERLGVVPVNKSQLEEEFQQIGLV